MARSFHGVDVNGATSDEPDHASARCRDGVQAQLPSTGGTELKDSLGSWKVQRGGIDTPKKGGRFSSSRLETSQGLLLGCRKETLSGLRFRVMGYCAGLCETVRGCVELSTVPKGKFGLRIRLKTGKLAKWTHIRGLIENSKLSIYNFYNLPQVTRFKTTEMYSLTVLKVGSPESRYWQGYALSEASRGQCVSCFSLCLW